MKKTLLLALLAIPFLKAQAQVTSMNYDFDLSCSVTDFPSTWIKFNPLESTKEKGAWKCTNDGHSTPGLKCSNYYDGAFHLDTSYLISPLINLSSYSGQNIFLKFDTKTSNIYLGGKLTVIASPFPDSTFRNSPYTDLSTSLMPVFSNGDSSDWVTHEVDMSPLVIAGSFYIAFRYTTDVSSGSTWYVDNVKTSTLSIAGTPTPPVANDALTIIGENTHGKVNFAYTAAGTNCRAIITDMLGRIIYDEAISTKTGKSFYNISSAAMSHGIYVLKVQDGEHVSTARLLMQ